MPASHGPAGKRLLSRTTATLLCFAWLSVLVPSTVAALKHDDRHRAAAPQASTELETIQTRQHQVEDPDLWALNEGGIEARVTIYRGGRIVPLSPQVVRDGFGEVGLVLHHQHPGL